MRYAILKVCQRHYDVSGSSLSIASDITTTIQSITPLYFNEFTKKYGGIHEYHIYYPKHTKHHTINILICLLNLYANLIIQFTFT